MDISDSSPEKMCKSCKQIKPLEEFSDYIYSKDKKRYSCRVCLYKVWQEYYEAHKERLLAKSKATVVERVAAYRKRNPNRWGQVQKKYKESHRAELAAREKMRQSVKRSAISCQFAEEILEFYKKSKKISDLTGIKHHVDHIIPLRGKNVTGLHVPWNLQILPALENIRKSNKVEGVI